MATAARRVVAAVIAAVILPDRGDRPQLRVRHLLDLELVVADAEIEVGLR
jgi:hypothetical protein